MPIRATERPPSRTEIMTARDPRIDPQPGDILRGNGQVRRIMAREGDRVRCASGEYDYRMLIDNWRKWCRLNDATAVRAASSSRGARKMTAA
jgi:hypothetical protein